MDLGRGSVFNQKFDSESELINIKNYFDDYGKLLTLYDVCEDEKCKSSGTCESCNMENCKNDQIYMNFLGISKEELNVLKEKTSTDHLKCINEKEYYVENINNLFSDESPAEVEEIISPLISVSNRIEMKSQFPRTFYKYCNYEWCGTKEKSASSKYNFDVLRFPTVVASVKVYHPFVSKRSNNLKIKLLQEIHVLGNQTLAHLKDKIVCSLDHIGDKDVSNECFLKNVGINVTAKDEYPSSFIFIENTFYNDMRTPNLIDLSKELREWAAEKKLGNFHAEKMENTYISDLNVRIGRPYVYQHLGNCEHIIVFSDIRFLDSNDPDRYSNFPRIHCTGRMYGKHCMMCTDLYAKWLVVGNERLIHDKAYLCKKCFISYNYINGKKVGDFEAYKYVHPTAIL